MTACCLVGGGWGNNTCYADALSGIDTSEPITVTIFQQADDVTMDEVENNPVTLYWEKMFNIDIEWQLPPRGSEQEQLTTMFGTGDYTEVISSGFSQENLPGLAQDGVIWELSEYLEEYAPNYYAYLNDPANADDELIHLLGGQPIWDDFINALPGTVLDTHFGIQAGTGRRGRPKAAGFNAIRSAHHPASPALLDACDRLTWNTMRGNAWGSESWTCYRVELIGVREMTRVTLVERASGHVRFLLPGKAGMALLAVRTNGSRANLPDDLPMGK